MARYAHALEADSDLRNGHSILLNMSHDMGKLHVMYGEFCNAVHGHDVGNIRKTLYLFKKFAILSFSLKRLRVVLTLPDATELMILVKYLTLSINIRCMYRSYVKFACQEVIKLESLPNFSTHPRVLYLCAELLGKLVRERYEAKQYIRANIMNVEGELEIGQVLNKMFVWHDNLIQEMVRNEIDGGNRDGAGRR